MRRGGIRLAERRSLWSRPCRSGGVGYSWVSFVSHSRPALSGNYPISAHLRFLLEQIRPEMRQYFFEDDKDGRPFSRDKRAVAYQRAKMVLDKRPFGTQYDVYAQGFEWVRHSMMPGRSQPRRSASDARCSRCRV